MGTICTPKLIKYEIKCMKILNNSEVSSEITGQKMLDAGFNYKSRELALGITQAIQNIVKTTEGFIADNFIKPDRGFTNAI